MKFKTKKYIFYSFIAIYLTLTLFLFIKLTSIYIKEYQITVFLFEKNEEATNELLKKIEKPIQFLKSSLSGLSTLIITLSAVFATWSYINTNRSNTISNYIDHYNLFKDTINKECEKEGIKKIDHNKWYIQIFPEAMDGNLIESKDYLTKIEEIKKAIIDSNKKQGIMSFNYKKHQANLIKPLKEIGIKIEHLPRINFNESETKILKIIDKVNLTFISKKSNVIRLSEIERNYI